MTSFVFGILGAGIVFVFLVIWGLRSRSGQLPGELAELRHLLSGDWRLVSWNRQSMGWFGKFKLGSRTFDVSSHRGDIEIYEIADGGRREISASANLKTPKDIYEFLTKAVA